MAFDQTQLNVGVVVDVSAIGPATTQVSAQVEQMAAKIKTAFGSIAHAPEEVQLALQMLNAELARTTPNAANVASMMTALDDSLKLTGAGAQQAGQQIEVAMTRATRSVTEARLGAQLLGQEMGVHFPRALSTILARSETIGPALNAAFGTIAVIGFIELAVQAAEKISNLISEIFIFSAAEKATYAQLVKDNEAILQVSQKINAQLRANALIGLSGAAAEKLKVEFNEKDATAIKVNLAAQQAKLATLKEQYAVALKQREAAAEVVTGAPEEPLAAGVAAGAAEKDMRELQIQIDSTNSSIGVMQKQLQLLGIEGTGLGKKMGVDQAKEASEAWKKANREMEQGFKDRAAIQKETGQALAAVMTEEFQAEIEGGKRETQSYLANLKEQEKGRQESAKERIRVAKQEADETLKAAVASAKETMKADDQRFQHQFVMGQIGEARLIDLKKQAVEQEFQAEKTALERRISELGSKELAERKKLSDEIIALEQKKDDTIAELNNKLAEKIHTSLEKGFENAINRPLDTMVQGVLLGTQRIDVAFARMGANMVASMVESFAKMTLKSAETWAVLEIQTLLGLGAIDAAQKAQGFGQVMRNAYKAASQAYADVPFPANLVAAPLVFATVAALGGGASAQRGAIIPADNMVLFPHAQEMVLPADISKGLQGAIRGGSLGGGTGETHLHLHIHALDAKDMQDWISRGGGHEINRHLGKTLRGMGLTPR
jgi:phage gpG-like protein